MYGLLYSVLGFVLVNVRFLNSDLSLLSLLSIPLIGLGLVAPFSKIRTTFSFLESLVLGSILFIVFSAHIQAISYFTAINYLFLFLIFLCVIIILNIFTFNVTGEFKPSINEVLVIVLMSFFIVVQILRNLNMMGSEDEYGYLWATGHPEVFLSTFNIPRILFLLSLAFLRNISSQALFFRLFMVFLSSLLVPITYLLVQRLLNDNKRYHIYSLLSAGLVGLFPAVVENAPRIYADIMMAVFVSFSLLLFLRYLGNKSNLLLLTSAVIFVLSIFVKQTSLIFTPLFLLVPKSNKKRLVLMSFSVLFVVMVPFTNFLVKDIILSWYDSILRFLTGNILLSSRLNTLLGGGISMLLFIPLLFFVSRKRPKNMFLLIMILYISVFFLFSVYWAQGMRHSFFLVPFFVVSIVYILKLVFLRSLFPVATVLLLSFLLFTSYPLLPTNSDYFLEKTASWIKQNTFENETIITNAFEALSFYSGREVYGVPRNETIFYEMISNNSFDYLIVLNLYPLKHYDEWPYLRAYGPGRTDNENLKIVYEENGIDPFESSQNISRKIITIHKRV